MWEPASQLGWVSNVRPLEDQLKQRVGLQVKYELEDQREDLEPSLEGREWTLRGQLWEVLR